MTASTKTVHDIDSQTAKLWVERGEATLVDVREPFEHAAEHIPNTTNNPLSGFEPARLPRSGRVVLYCNSGNRSKTAGKKSLASGAGEAYHLAGGIQAWKQDGLPVVRARRAPIDVMRQVQITAGSLVLIGVVLALLVSPWAILLSGFVGAGLIFAGASGFCAMARILGFMPWNSRATRGQASGRLAADENAA